MINSRVIIACDFSSWDELISFLNKFNGEKLFLKIGYQLFFTIGIEKIKQLQLMGHNIFLDLKLHDIPNTVAHGVESLSKLGVDMLTIHASGGMKMMSAATTYNNPKTRLLAVTHLTSSSQEMLNNELFINEDINVAIKKLAINAYKSKINGVICSGLESKMIKENTSVDFLVVSPGIRYPDSNSDDQHRICTPKMAKENGCDYIVVGRLITKSTNPLEMYKKVVNDFMGEN